MSAQFTPQAALLWAMIPKQQQENILRNVWCRDCRGEVCIVDYTGTKERGHVILRGRCGTCGGSVARLVETGDRRPPTN